MGHQSYVIPYVRYSGDDEYRQLEPHLILAHSFDEMDVSRELELHRARQIPSPPPSPSCLARIVFADPPMSDDDTYIFLGSTKGKRHPPNRSVKRRKNDVPKNELHLVHLSNAEVGCLH